MPRFYGTWASLCLQGPVVLGTVKAQTPSKGIPVAHVPEAVDRYSSRDRARARLEIAVHAEKWTDAVKEASLIANLVPEEAATAAMYVAQAQVYATMARSSVESDRNYILQAQRRDQRAASEEMVRLKADHNKLVDESLQPMRVHPSE